MTGLVAVIEVEVVREAVEVPLIVMAPEASISSIAEFKSTSRPVPSSVKLPPVEVTVTPAPPTRVNTPVVVTFDAPTASKDNAPVKSPVKVAEFKSMSCPVAVTLNSPLVAVAVMPSTPVKFKAPVVVVSTVNAPEATVTFDAPTASKDNAQ